jgi:murein DD-endopeptidase MepM/ murein hydrolase activator NlpD
MLWLFLILGACGLPSDRMRANDEKWLVSTPLLSRTLVAPSISPQILQFETISPVTVLSPETSPSSAAGDWTQPAEMPSPTITSISLVYVFPVRPLRWVDYIQGHSGYPATDIFAPEGYEFLAVTSGVVDFVCAEDLWDPTIDDPATRGGLSVAIIGDDGVRYYGSHLSQIAEGMTPGVRVAAGQVLGYVGRTGNARNTISHVHFAISAPTFPEDWKTRRGQIDPFPYLAAWQRGEWLMPDLSQASP